MKIEQKSLELLEDYNLISEKTDLRSLCKKLDMDIVPYAFTGCEGVLLVTPDAQKILVRATNAGVRNRFTIAHELGHYTLHMPESGHRSFNCSKDQIGTDLGISEVEESQANQFASALLMPKHIFQNVKDYKNPSWSILDQLSKRHEVSMVAAATRYISLTSESMWLLVVKSGYIQRFVKSPFAESIPTVGHKLTAREIKNWMDIGAENIFYDNQWTRNKTVSITSLGQNEYGENLILIWDRGHSLMNNSFDDGSDYSDFDDDESYERNTRGRSYR